MKNRYRKELKKKSNIADMTGNKETGSKICIVLQKEIGCCADYKCREAYITAWIQPDGGDQCQKEGTESTGGFISTRQMITQRLLVMQI